MTVLNVVFTVFERPARPTTCASFVDLSAYPSQRRGRGTLRRGGLRIFSSTPPHPSPTSGAGDAAARSAPHLLLYAPRAAGAGQGDRADVGQPPVALGVVQAVPHQEPVLQGLLEGEGRPLGVDVDLA